MEEFVVGFRINKSFNRWVASNFTMEGSGAALFLGALYLHFRQCLIAGLLLMVVGALALFLDLGNPLRSWRSFFKLGRSWISRGAVLLACLLILGSLFTFFPHIQETGIGLVIKVALTILSILTVLYTGLLISSMDSVPSWNTWMVPLLFLLHSAATGSIILYYSAGLFGLSYPSRIIGLSVVFLLVAVMVSTMVYLKSMVGEGLASGESVRRMIKGELKIWFWAGSVLLGDVVPLVLVAASLAGSAAAGSLLILLGVATRLAGDFAFRCCVLQTGIYKPVLAST